MSAIICKQSQAARSCLTQRKGLRNMHILGDANNEKGESEIKLLYREMAVMKIFAEEMQLCVWDSGNRVDELRRCSKVLYALTNDN